MRVITDGSGCEQEEEGEYTQQKVKVDTRVSRVDNNGGDRALLGSISHSGYRVRVRVCVMLIPSG